MSGLDRAVRDGVKRGIGAATPSIVDVCLNALWDHPWFPFIAGAQVRLMETGMKPRKAWELGRQVLTDYVRDEKIEFGDPRFSWGPDAGRDVIQECEIDHWDAA